VLVPGNITLTSRTAAEIAMDYSANLAAVGVNGRWELVQFQDVELTDTDLDTGEKTYVLSTLLRGRRGTEWAVGTGVAGDRFALLDGAITRIALPSSMLGVAANYQPVTDGLEYGDVASQAFASAGVALEPFSPVDIAATWDGLEATITWKRRTRALGDVPPGGGDVPLFEAAESYDVELWVGSVLVATETVTEQQLVTTDAVEGDTEVRIFQNSALVGRGTAGVAEI
jgi:hypothetical protein